MPYSLDSLLNRIWWLIVSKAADISIMISAVKLFLSKAVSVSFVIFINAGM